MNTYKSYPPGKEKFVFSFLFLIFHAKISSPFFLNHEYENAPFKCQLKILMITYINY